MDFLLRGGMCIAQELSEEIPVGVKTRIKILDATAHHEVGKHHRNNEKLSTIDKPITDPLLYVEMSHWLYHFRLRVFFSQLSHIAQLACIELRILPFPYIERPLTEASLPADSSS